MDRRFRERVGGAEVAVRADRQTVDRREASLQADERFSWLVPAALLVAAAGYLVPFVRRGWFPHDEGMIGQSAERLLHGQLPHVDYAEPYTGALTLLHAVIFSIAGPDLVHIRWMLLGATLVALLVSFRLLRRGLPPLAAAGAAALLLAWGPPNYFASLPSWWLLISAIVCLAALVCFFETGRLGYVALAGLAVGGAIVIKQTGVYLIVPLVMSLLLATKCREGTAGGKTLRLARIAVGVVAVAMALYVMRRRLGAPEIVYLLAPIIASSVALIWWKGERVEHDHWPWTPATLGCVIALLPLSILLMPYLAGGHLGDFIQGALVVPQQRVTFASKELPPAIFMLFGPLAFAALVWVPPSLSTSELRILRIARWLAAIVLLILSLSHILAYQFIWQSARSITTLLPIASTWLILANTRRTPLSPSIVFAASAVLAWASLVQFPFGAPIYFCYVAPLAVIVAVLLLKAYPIVPLRELRVSAFLLLGFAVISMNRSYPGPLGVMHQPLALETPLQMPKASLIVSEHDAAVYQEVVTLVRSHIATAERLVAGPDAPEIYFLCDAFSPSGTLFDFLDRQGRATTASDWLEASLIVINLKPDFSPALPAELLARLRETFPNGQQVGRFEVRWND